jgi:hypothetical protein
MGTMPMMALMVVDFPVPFLPRSDTTSPSKTLRLTPFKTCASPYRAFSH